MSAIPAQRSIIQFAWVVNDLGEAMQRWFDTSGVGPFMVNRKLTITDPVYRGEPGEVDFSTAIAQAGPVQIELVQQNSDGPSCYRDTVPAGTEAMHHVGVMPEDYDAALARYLDQGLEVASSGLFGDVRFAYVDCTSTLGHMVEIIEDKPMINRFFGAIAKASREWDGDPATLVREL